MLPTTIINAVFDLNFGWLGIWSASLFYSIIYNVGYVFSSICSSLFSIIISFYFYIFNCSTSCKLIILNLLMLIDNNKVNTFLCIYIIWCIVSFKCSILLQSNITTFSYLLSTMLHIYIIYNNLLCILSNYFYLLNWFSIWSVNIIYLLFYALFIINYVFPCLTIEFLCTSFNTFI